MMRTSFTILSAILAISALPSQHAGADEIRHTTFPNVLVGPWAPSAELCAAKDKSNISIAADGYSTADGKCSLRWIVETAGSLGRTSPFTPSARAMRNRPSQTSSI